MKKLRVPPHSPSVPRSVPRSVPSSVLRSVPRSVLRSVPSYVPTSVPRSVPRSVLRSVPCSVLRSVPSYVPTSVARTVARSVPRSVQRSFPRSVSRSVLRSVPRSVPYFIVFIVDKRRLSSIFWSLLTIIEPVVHHWSHTDTQGWARLSANSSQQYTRLNCYTKQLVFSRRTRTREQSNERSGARMKTES